MGWEGEAQEEGTCVYLQLILVIVQQRLTQHCHAIILQLKKERHTHHVQVSGIPCPAYLLCHHQKDPQGTQTGIPIRSEATVRLPSGDGHGTLAMPEIRPDLERSYPTPEVRGCGLEELLHARGQGRWPRGATPRPRSSGCADAGGPRGATPRSRSGEVAMRRYPLSKVRSSGCTLLEQP